MCPVTKYYTLPIMKLNSSGSANTQLPGCLRPWTFPLNIGLNMFHSDSFMSRLVSLLGDAGVFQAFQLFALTVFGTMD